MTYLSCSKSDQYYKFNYNIRILDALASLFHIETKCSSVFRYKDVLYISYNKQIHIKEKQKVEKTLQITFEALKNNLKDDVLVMYLLHNIDFNTFLTNQYKFEQDVCFKKKLKSFSDLLDGSRTFLQFTDIEEESDKIDKFNELFTTNSEFTNAIGEIGVQIYKSLENFSKAAEKAKRCLYIKIIADYEDLILSLKEYKGLIHSAEEKNIQIKEQFLRPLQDISKILYKVHHAGYRIDSVEILDNKFNLHAEQNIILYFPKALIEGEGYDSYIGVSKLCCTLCHKYLELHGYKHRGTHGTWDSKWIMYSSIVLESFKAPVLDQSKEIEDEDAPFQYRRLSIDNFEELCPELYQNKVDFRFYPGCGSALESFYDAVSADDLMF